MIEIPVDDVQKAKVFYKHVFGWNSEQIPFVDYWKNEQGSLIKRMSTQEHPLPVIKVDNLHDCLERVKKAGGKVVYGPKKFGPYEQYARFQDSEGNIIAVHE